MLYRRFGRTGLSMPVVSCGLMRSMFSWQDIDLGGIPDIRHQEQAAVVDAALQLGITHLETARGYGSCERQLGTVLSAYPRDAYILQTKVRPENDPDRFVANVLDSLARLGQKRVDLLALHGINDYHSLWQSCRPGGCLAAARRLQAEGRVGWVGFSGHADLPVILSAVEHEGDQGFDYLNLHWYTIRQGNVAALQAAARRDMGVFIISPTDKGGMLQDPPELLSSLSDPLAPLQFNDLFCLQRQEVHTISVGASRPDDFTAHVDALEYLEDREMVEGIYSRWQRILRKRCHVDRPDAHWRRFPSWMDTPGYINIPFILWLDTLARGWDLLQFARSRYRMLGRDMPWVSGNNAAEAGKYDFKKPAAGADMSGIELCGRLLTAHALLSRE